MLKIWLLGEETEEVWQPQVTTDANFEPCVSMRVIAPRLILLMVYEDISMNLGPILVVKHDAQRSRTFGAATFPPLS